MGRGDTMTAMFQCEDCGKIFEEPARYPDFIGEFWGAPFTKYYDSCPYCKSEEIEEAAEDDC